MTSISWRSNQELKPFIEELLVLPPDVKSELTGALRERSDKLMNRIAPTAAEVNDGRTLSELADWLDQPGLDVIVGVIKQLEAVQVWSAGEIDS